MSQESLRCSKQSRHKRVKIYFATVHSGCTQIITAAMHFVGKWSPNGEETWQDDSQGQKRNGSVQLESQPQVPVWTPRSAQSSPVVSRKQYRPVQFNSPRMERKFTNLNGVAGESSIPPWEQPGFDKLPPPVQHHTSHQDNKSSVRRLAQSFSAPKLNSGIVDGHSESYSKHSLNYVCPPTRSLFEGNRYEYIESV